MIGTDIPPIFWQGLTQAEFNGIMARDGLLTRAQTLHVWQLVGGVGVPPFTRMRIVLNKDDVELWLQRLKSETQH